MMSHNNTSTSELLSCYGKVPKGVLATVSSTFLMSTLTLDIFICITATSGNLVMLISLWRKTSLHTPPNILLFNLTLSDIAAGMVAKPLSIAFDVLLARPGGTQCTLFVFSSNASTFLTALTLITLTTISVDRYLAISLHMRYEALVTEKKATVVVFILWLVCGFLSSTCLISGFKLFSTVMASAGAICIVLLLIVWIQILRVVKRHQSQILDQLQGQNQSFNIAKFRKSSIHRMLLIFGFLFCYVPYVASLIVLRVDFSVSNYASYRFAITFVFLHSSLNPVLTCWFDRQIRDAVKKTLAKFCCCERGG